MGEACPLRRTWLARARRVHDCSFLLLSLLALLAPLAPLTLLAPLALLARPLSHCRLDTIAITRAPRDPRPACADLESRTGLQPSSHGIGTRSDRPLMPAGALRDSTSQPPIVLHTSRCMLSLPFRNPQDGQGTETVHSFFGG